MSDSIEIRSPLSKSLNVSKIRDINLAWLIQAYAEKFEYNISEFTELDNCQLFIDNVTGYQFFYPNTLVGSSSFYSHLSNFDWYYDSDKWEFRKAIQYINKNDRVIEIGCGNGSFLSLLQDQNIIFRGLELSTKLISKNFNKNVFQTPIKEYAQQNPNNYSVCCFFQVLEHVPDVYTFLKSAISLIEPGGKLIISVPNNGSYIKYLDQEILNYPPHHMGRWDRKSLKSLSKLFDLRLLEILEEPLQVRNINSFIWSLGQRNLFRWMIKYSLLRRFLRAITRVISPFIKGHTIMAIYTKEK